MLARRPRDHTPRPRILAVNHSTVIATIVAIAVQALPVAHAGAASPTTEPPAATVAPAPLASVVVLPPQLGVETDVLLLERLTSELRAGLTRGRLAVIEPGAEVPSPCDRACLARLRAETGGDYVLRTAVAIDDRDYVIRLELVDITTGELLADSETRCDLCGLREFGAVVADQGALLRAKIEGLRRPPPAVIITTDPPGALITIDGVAIGASPIERVLVAGKHRVRANLTGYVADERDVELVPGVRETLRLPLRRDPRALRLRAVGWTALFTGLPVMGAGVGLLAIAGNDVRDPCTGDDRDDQGDCRYVYTTTPGGAALLATGAVLGVLGAILLARTRDRGRGRRVQTTFSPGGAGLIGSF